MKNMENARDALVDRHAPAFENAPACAAAGQGCAEKLARYFGSKDGFNGTKPDQASSGAVSVLLLRDHRGDFALAGTTSKTDVWLTVLRSGKGVGVDMLRLAVFRRAEDVSPRLAKSWDDESALGPFFADVASVVPGACKTYGLLGAGKPSEVLPAVDDEDHSACVQADLSRREGPGPLYGTGPFRGAAGALAVYRDTLHSLRMGLPNMAPAVRKVIEGELLSLEVAADKIVLKKVVRPGADAALHLANVHALAGAPMKAPVDAGSGPADAGAKQP